MHPQGVVLEVERAILALLGCLADQMPSTPSQSNELTIRLLDSEQVALIIKYIDHGNRFPGNFPETIFLTKRDQSQFPGFFPDSFPEFPGFCLDSFWCFPGFSRFFPGFSRICPGIVPEFPGLVPVFFPVFFPGISRMFP